MRVGDHASIVKMVWTGDVREMAVEEEDIPLLRRHCRDLLAVFDVVVVSALNRWVQSFRMVIEVLHETYGN